MTRISSLGRKKTASGLIKIYPTSEMKRKMNMGWLGCISSLYLIIFIGLYTTLFGSSGHVTFTWRDILSIILYGIASYAIHKRQWVWTAIAFQYYVIDKLIYWSDFGMADHILLQIPIFSCLLAGAMGYSQFQIYRQKYVRDNMSNRSNQILKR